MLRIRGCCITILRGLDYCGEFSVWYFTYGIVKKYICRILYENTQDC